METEEVFAWVGIAVGLIAGLNIGGFTTWKKMSDKMEEQE